MKKGKQARYFEGKMTDGMTQMRLVGFQSAQQKSLSSFQEKMGASVALENCEVKRSQVSKELEIVLKSSSWVVASPKKFEVDGLERMMKPEIVLNELVTKHIW